MDYVIRARNERTVGSEVLTGSSVSIRIATPDRIVVNVRAGAPGPPGPSGAGANYVHSQESALSVWTINHNLGTRPAIEVRNAAGQVILAEVVHNSANQATANFVAAILGTAFCSL